MSRWDTETAEWYAQKYGEYATNRLGVSALKLAPDVTVIDVGCGTGSALRHAAGQVTDGCLIGVDPVHRMIEIAREKTAGHPAENRVKYLQGSAEAIPIEDACADVVFAFDSFDHWQDHAKGLEEVRRVLKPDGRFVVGKDGGLPSGADALQDFLGLLLNAGFRVTAEKHIEEDDVSFTQWVCVFDN